MANINNNNNNNNFEHVDNEIKDRLLRHVNYKRAQNANTLCKSKVHIMYDIVDLCDGCLEKGHIVRFKKNKHITLSYKHNNSMRKYKDGLMGHTLYAPIEGLPVKVLFFSRDAHETSSVLVKPSEYFVKQTMGMLQVDSKGYCRVPEAVCFIGVDPLMTLNLRVIKSYCRVYAYKTCFAKISKDYAYMRRNNNRNSESEDIFDELQRKRYEADVANAKASAKALAAQMLESVSRIRCTNVGSISFPDGSNFFGVTDDMKLVRIQDIDDNEFTRMMASEVTKCDSVIALAIHDYCLKVCSKESLKLLTGRDKLSLAATLDRAPISLCMVSESVSHIPPVTIESMIDFHFGVTANSYYLKAETDGFTKAVSDLKKVIDYNGTEHPSVIELKEKIRSMIKQVVITTDKGNEYATINVSRHIRDGINKLEYTIKFMERCGICKIIYTRNMHETLIVSSVYVHSKSMKTYTMLNQISHRDSLVRSRYTTMRSKLSKRNIRDVPLCEARHHFKYEYQSAKDTLTEDQMEIFDAVIENPIVCMCGMPGTGKSEVISKMVSIFRSYGCLVCCYFGCAVMNVRNRVPSYNMIFTIDDLLHRVQRGEIKPECFRVLILDEASTIGTLHMTRILETLTALEKIVFVGDKDQMPCIGPGSIMEDIFESYGPFKTLDKNLRTDQSSAIILDNSKLVTRGQGFETLKWTFKAIVPRTQFNANTSRSDYGSNDSDLDYLLSSGVEYNAYMETTRSNKRRSAYTNNINSRDDRSDGGATDSSISYSTTQEIDEAISDPKQSAVFLELEDVDCDETACMYELFMNLCEHIKLEECKTRIISLTNNTVDTINAICSFYMKQKIFGDQIHEESSRGADIGSIVGNYLRSRVNGDHKTILKQVMYSGSMIMTLENVPKAIYSIRFKKPRKKRGADDDIALDSNVLTGSSLAVTKKRKRGSSHPKNNNKRHKRTIEEEGEGEEGDNGLMCDDNEDMNNEGGDSNNNNDDDDDDENDCNESGYNPVPHIRLACDGSIYKVKAYGRTFLEFDGSGDDGVNAIDGYKLYNKYPLVKYGLEGNEFEYQKKIFLEAVESGLISEENNTSYTYDDVEESAEDIETGRCSDGRNNNNKESKNRTKKLLESIEKKRGSQIYEIKSKDVSNGEILNVVSIDAYYINAVKYTETSMPLYIDIDEELETIRQKSQSGKHHKHHVSETPHYTRTAMRDITCNMCIRNLKKIDCEELLDMDKWLLVANLENNDKFVIASRHGKSNMFTRDSSGKRKFIVSEGWCSTVNKIQGAESTNVVVYIPTCSVPNVFNRNTLYTAITRPKKKLVVISSTRRIQELIDRESERKKSILKELISCGSKK